MNRPLAFDKIGAIACDSELQFANARPAVINPLDLGPLRLCLLPPATVDRFVTKTSTPNRHV